MGANTWGVLAVVGYATAAVLAAIAVILFFTLHIRSVRDDLTGRTAQRAIASLRDGKASRSRFFGGEERGSAARQGARVRAAAQGASDSGSLKLRRYSSNDEVATGQVEEEECSTTLLGRGATQATDAMAGDEQGTTMLGEAQPAPVRTADPADGTTTLLNGASGADDGATTLIGGQGR